MLARFDEARQEENKQNTKLHCDFSCIGDGGGLEKCNGFIKKENVKLITDYPVAYESNDYLVPHVFSMCSFTVVVHLFWQFL